ncbi:MAG: acetoacetyl-CoA reductase [Thermoflexibacter sp.]|jgi:acetoacetyl-CoA reductase|nr:acetoacetyl-CoA reductase [Thermoflexibacter sp.]
MDKDNKRIALVTGCTGGLGTAICKKLYNDGYRVVGNYLTHSRGEAWSAEMQAEEYNISIYQCDVTDYDKVGEMIKQIEEEIGGIDVLVNNAAITKDGQFKKMTYERWDLVMKTNLYSVFNCTRHTINQMIERHYGRIINISSVNAQRGQFGQVNYAAAKAGVHGFTKTLAVEVAGKGITVNTISPGYIATDMVMSIAEDVRRKIIESIPVGRLGGTEEIAYLVSFLASEQSSFITGVNYAINGGQHMY